MNKYKHDYYKLVSFADNFLMDNYGLKLNIPIRISKRLKNSLGYFTEYIDSHQGEGAVSITINSDMMNYATEYALHDVLKHELVHYALYMTGKPYLDGEEYFENELRRLGISSTEEVYVSKEFITQCEDCLDIDVTKLEAVANNKNGKRKSRCCGSKFNNLGEIIFDGRDVSEVIIEHINKIRKVELKLEVKSS